MPEIKVSDLIVSLGGTLLAVHGSEARVVTHAAAIQEAGDARALTFCNRPRPQCIELMRNTESAVVVCGEAQISKEVLALGKTLMVVLNPRLAFLRLVQRFLSPARPSGIHATASVSPDAQVDSDVYVGPFAYIGKAVIGRGSVVHGHVHVYDGVRIGRSAMIHAGAIIGADGFGYEPNEHGQLEKFPHIGGVILEDHVEVGACSCVDRGSLGNTLLREGCRIDNLVHIAHNVVVGRNALVIAHAMIGGSTVIGDSAWIAPSACVRDGLVVGAHARVGLGSVVVKDVPDGATVMGAPAQPADEYKAMLSALRRLGDGNG